MLIAHQQISGEPGSTVSVDFTLINNSPVNDSFQVEVRDENGEILSALPSPIALEPLAREDFSLEITVPSESGKSGATAVTAVSVSNPDVSAKSEIGAAGDTVSGDADGSGTIDLRDAVSVLKVLAGMQPDGVYTDADVDGDGQIGFAELVYVLKKLSE